MPAKVDGHLPTRAARRSACPEGTSLFNAAHWAGLPIESTCGGRGTCGKCGVRILAGEAEATQADHRHLADRLDEGWRLSCQCPVAGDMEVRGAAPHEHAEGGDDGRGPLRPAGAERREADLRPGRALAAGSPLAPRASAGRGGGGGISAHLRSRHPGEPGARDARRHAADGDVGGRSRRRRGAGRHDGAHVRALVRHRHDHLRRHPGRSAQRRRPWPWPPPSTGRRRSAPT